MSLGGSKEALGRLEEALAGGHDPGPKQPVHFPAAFLRVSQGGRNLDIGGVCVWALPGMVGASLARAWYIRV